MNLTSRIKDPIDSFFHGERFEESKIFPSIRIFYVLRLPEILSKEINLVFGRQISQKVLSWLLTRESQSVVHYLSGTKTMEKKSIFAINWNIEYGIHLQLQRIRQHVATVFHFSKTSCFFRRQYYQPTVFSFHYLVKKSSSFFSFSLGPKSHSQEMEKVLLIEYLVFQIKLLRNYLDGFSSQGINR